jgi:hypothetical protein
MRFFLFIIACIYSISAFTQVGGRSVYEFLNIPVSARAASVGGVYNNIYDGDAGLATNNPAQLQPMMHKHMSLTYLPYFAGTHYSNFNYVHNFDFATFQFGTIFMNYGQNKRYDEFGVEQGLFNVNDVALFAGAGKKLSEKYSVGANTKLVYSQIDNFWSMGFFTDLAGMYIDTAKLFTASLVLSNIGFQMKSYTRGNQELMPFDVQLGFSKRFKHLPFRIMVTAHNFQRWDMQYDNPNPGQTSTGIFGPPEEKSGASIFFDNLARHLTLGGEFELGKALRLGFGYNHQRRAELKLDSRGGFSGFSFGMGVHIKRFDIQYAIGRYTLAGAANQLTLNINLGEQTKTRKAKSEE